MFEGQSSNIVFNGAIAFASKLAPTTVYLWEGAPARDGHYAVRPVFRVVRVAGKRAPTGAGASLLAMNDDAG